MFTDGNRDRLALCEYSIAYENGEIRGCRYAGIMKRKEVTLKQFEKLCDPLTHSWGSKRTVSNP